MPSLRCLLLLATILTGCAHRPADLADCRLPMERLTLPAPDDSAPGLVSDAAAAAPTSAFEQAFARALSAPPPQDDPGNGPRPTTRPAALFLSGGSQNGAFGAGFLDRWKQAGGLPEFAVVTGVSTGALIGATAFTGDTDRAVAGYTIASEADLLDVKARSVLGAARFGAFGTLDPLRKRLDASFDSDATHDDDELLGRVAAAGAAGRRFFVGVVDAREGEAYAIDMTALAGRWATAATADKPAVKQCYIAALIASSSVPLAAPPQYIDGHMLIDGGARFGVFRAFEARGMAAGRAAASRRSQAPAPASFVLLNTRWEIAAQCPFESAGGAACPASGTLRKWDVLGLAQRSVDILTNQIYRFSLAEAAAPGAALVDRLRPEAGAHVFEGRSCDDWRALDRADKPPPVQFHKREMRCLIDYGRARADIDRWWEKD